jgi:hypothetical protein
MGIVPYRLSHETGTKHMSATPSVTLFNANMLGVTVQVNNGPQIPIAAANTTTWAPSSPTSGAPTWSNTTPAPNVFAPGNNSLIVTPTGYTTPFVTTINLPYSVQWSSLQVYFFFNSYQSASWIALNAGQYITGNLLLSAVHHAEAHHSEAHHKEKV